MSEIIPDGIICNAASFNSTSSTSGTGIYNPTPIGGTPLPTTVMYGAAIAAKAGVGVGLPMILVNPTGPFVPVPGLPTSIVPPVPLTLPRLKVIFKQNVGRTGDVSGETGVRINGIPVVVNGDLINGPGATPTNIPLTGATIYPTILIGTNIPKPEPEE